MKTTHEFRPNSMHRYTLPPGVMVQSAKLAARQVDIWPNTGAREIFRDGKKVGEWPARGFTYVVQGMMSGTAPTLEAARARAEHIARANNDRYGKQTRRHHAMTLEAARAAVRLEIEDGAALMARYPYTPAEVESLKASRHHADVLEPPTQKEVARRITELTGC